MWYHNTHTWTCPVSSAGLRHVQVLQDPCSLVGHSLFPGICPSLSCPLTFIALWKKSLKWIREKGLDNISLLAFILFTYLLLSPCLDTLNRWFVSPLSRGERSEGLKGFRDHWSLWESPLWRWWMLTLSFGEEKIRKKGWERRRKKLWGRTKKTKRSINK